MMDHPEPISKRPMEIPQCRKSFTLEEARTFIDQVMDVFHGLEDMSDLRSMYETGKQLSRAYFDCHSYRVELAQHLTTCEYPTFASKMMKKLNNMGVFKNDDIWFSSFYFYNTTWNFSDTFSDFATALAAAGLPNLLNLNIAHQPYLENLSSKNVYYLIKASLSIIHNIARVPGNTHHFTAESVRQALLHLAQREEEFLRCVSSLCLAHVIMEPEAGLITDPSGSGGIDLLRVLYGYINSARSSEKRRCHGFQVIELLCALSACSVHDPLKPGFATTTSGPTGVAVTEQSVSLVGLLKDLVEIALLAAPSTVALREAEEAARTLWNLSFCDHASPSSASMASALNNLKTWLTEQLCNPATQNQLTKAMLRALEATQWRLNRPFSLAQHNTPAEYGTIMFSYAPANRNAVMRIAGRLRDHAMPLNGLLFSTEKVNIPEATLVGMSMSAINAASHTQWLEAFEQAPVLVVCFSDAYRNSPGCRLETEYFTSTSTDSNPKTIIPVVVQPKFKTTGWLTRLTTTKHAIDFNGKRDMDAQYDTLTAHLKELMVEARKREEASFDAINANLAAAAAATATQRHLSVDGKRHMVLAGDTGVTGNSGVDQQQTPQHNQFPNACSRTASGLSNKREELSMANLCNHLPPAIVGSATASRPLATSAWRHVIRPEVRNWSTTRVATWLRFRGLGHIPAQMAGGIDGVLLSQLAGLRLWAPEYFTQSLRNELNLGFADSLRFLEALDELAPSESNLDCDEDKPVDGQPDQVVDTHAHLNSTDRAASRA